MTSEYKKADGTVLAPDAPFSHNGINYPANWLKLSEANERDALGITETIVPNEFFDPQFYYAKDQPKDIAKLKTSWVAMQKETANTYLSKCDWLVIREKEGGTACPDAWKTYRANVRTVSGTREGEINAAANTAALKTLIDENKLTAWPTEPT